MPYRINNFFNIVNNVPSLYILILYLLLIIYVVLSWLGRLNNKLKHILFESSQVDTSIHFIRYTIFPTVIFILFSWLIIEKIITGERHWFNYGNKNIFIIFCLIIIMFFLMTLLVNMNRKKVFGSDPKKIKTYIPGIIGMSSMIVFIVITIFLVMATRE